MGGCLSVSLACDQMVNQDGNYIFQLEENLEALEMATQVLKERRDDVFTRLRNEEDRGLERLPVVQSWLLKVEEIISRVDELLTARTAEVQRLCCSGWCSKNCKASYKYGKRVYEARRKVEDLAAIAFEQVAESVPAYKVEEMPIPRVVGMETMLEKAWRCLMVDGIGVLGLYGMGGVGKTTLLLQINNKCLAEGNMFDIVIWIVVSLDHNVERIQEAIGKRLGLLSEEWRWKRQDEKACDIYHVLKRAKFMLLLDDIWMEVNLEEVGVPYPDKHNGCKIAFTTRSRHVTALMGADVEMEVGCLAPNDAWDLFRQKVGERTLNSHPEIPRLAKIVAQKCRGLPLSLNVVGRTMACKRTIQEWRHVIDVLTSSSAANFPDRGDQILSILKFSYDNLEGIKAKSCFLYCALFPEEYKMRKDELLDYWIGEGIIDRGNDRDRAVNEGYWIIGTLVDASLLLEDEFGECVEMHDLIRDMALWISSGLGGEKQNCIVEAGSNLRQIPVVESWEAVTRVSLIGNQIEKISDCPYCPTLSTLLLQDNKLVNVSGEFFKCMPVLVVLDLSKNFNLTELPEEISMLVSLQYLNLSFTALRQLPIGLKKSRRLIYLNLEGTWKLRSIDGISCLSNIQVLKLSDSCLPFSLSLIEELSLLEHLKLLTLTQKVANVLEVFLGNYKLAICTKRLILEEFTSSPDGMSLPMTLSSLHQLEILNSDISEIKMDWESKRSEVSLLHDRSWPGSPCFQNLFHVSMFNCKGLRDLTWLLYAPNLARLEVQRSSHMEEIISRGKTDANEQLVSMLFQKLNSLDLRFLPKLKSIYWRPLSFPSLKKVVVRYCPDLRKLPLNSESASGQNLTIDAEKEWIEQLEWEDESTKQRFCPS